MILNKTGLIETLTLIGLEQTVLQHPMLGAIVDPFECLKAVRKAGQDVTSDY